MNRDTVKISVVSPVYMCAACLRDLCQRLQTVFEQMQVDYEIVLVDDGSPDDSWSTITSLAAKTPQITGLKLSRNFGQHRAIAAGLTHTSGDWIVVLDCDLQDQPEEIPKLFARAQDGFDLVLAARTSRKDGVLKRAFSAL